MKKLIYPFLIFLGLAASVFTAHADENFRRHRYDVLDSLPPAPRGSIIFLGNSITHMMEWRELFGDRADIFNRGVSGAHTYEVYTHLEHLLGEGPSKVFLMIGTNDLGDPGDDNSPQCVANRIISIILKILELNPDTKVYYQSILPTGKRWRTREKTEITNSIVKDWIESRNSDNVEYIDLYPAFADEEGEIMNTHANGTDNCLSLDGLHLTLKGYEIWVDIIKEYVGSEPQVKKESANLFGDLSGSPGMRISYFGGLPVRNSDILLFGDEVIHTGEWNELTGSGIFKDRGIGWGYPGPGLSKLQGAFLPTLKGNVENRVIKEAPAGVVFYAGTPEVMASDDINQVIKDYKHAIDSLRSILPYTPIFLMTLAPLPHSYGEKCSSMAILNDSIRQFSQEYGFYLIDIERCLSLRGCEKPDEITGENNSRDKKPEERDETCFLDPENIYLNGKGYKLIALKIREITLGVINPEPSVP